MQNTNITMGGREFELHLTDSGEAIIDKNAQFAFTRGHCHSLALAIHQETGWPIFGIGEGWGGAPLHCIVFAPEINDYIDIDGPGVKDRFGRIFEDKLQLIEVGRIPHLTGYLRPEPDAAKPFARKVLSEIPARGNTSGADSGALVQLV